MIVAVPVKDEAERIEACLLALANQSAVLPDAIVLRGEALGEQRLVAAHTVAAELATARQILVQLSLNQKIMA